MKHSESSLESQILANLAQTVEVADALLRDNQFIRAGRFLRKAIGRYPDVPYLRYLLAVACFHSVAFAEAVAVCDTLDHPDAVFLQARALTKVGDLARALPLFGSLYGTQIDRDDLANYHAEAMLQDGRPREALGLLEGRDSVWSGYHRGYLRLGLSDWPRGWEEYRGRDIFRDDLLHMKFRPMVLSEVSGRCLMFHEQGLGDTIQFLRYAALLRPLVTELIIAVPKCLIRLAETLNFPKTVIDIDQPLPEYDLVVPLLDCPALFGTTLATIPPSCYSLCRHAIPHERKKIGLCWQGGYRPKNVNWAAIDSRRSMAFEQMRPLLDLDYDFVSLQMEPSELPSLFDPDDDFYESAKKLNEVDLVITVDTAIAHLAGSIGCPVWLLSRFAGCWRWGWDDSKTSPWYPSMRIFRQQSPDTWPAVIADVLLCL